MKPSKTQLSALSRLFSPSVFREMAVKGRSPLFASLYAQAGLGEATSSTQMRVGSAFDTAFEVLRKSGLRDEYVYRSALTHNVLLGRHSLDTASMLTEFRAGECKADVVILNGTATVYEIKSDRDSLSRLENQILNYQKVFAKAYVVAGENHISQILNCLPSEVGVLSLIRWNRIQTVREAVERPDAVCPVTIFESLRVPEAQEVLRNLRIPVPEVPNILLRAAMREEFEKLPPSLVHQEVITVLKKSRNLASLKTLVGQLPKSLQPAALSIKLRKLDHERLVSAVQTPLGEAMTWA